MKLRVFYLTVCLALSYTVIAAKEYSAESRVLSPEQRNEQVAQVFNRIEAGIAKGDPDIFAHAFGSQTYISLPGGISGYYSPSQAFYILKDYFSIHSPLGFSFRTVNDRSDNPYASGTYIYESRGTRNTSRVFVSLKLFGNNWKISQISIN